MILKDFFLHGWKMWWEEPESSGHMTSVLRGQRWVRVLSSLSPLGPQHMVLYPPPHTVMMALFILTSETLSQTCPELCISVTLSRQSMPSLQSELVIQDSEREFRCKIKNKQEKEEAESPKANRTKWKAWVIYWKEGCSPPPRESGCVMVVGAVVNMGFPPPKMET